jgi:type IV secretory pathway component VirB8
MSSLSSSWRTALHLAITGRTTVKKIIIALTAVAFMGGATLIAPTPASALIPYFVLESKKDKNFKAVNPYAKKATKKSKKKAAKKSAKKPAKKK